MPKLADAQIKQQIKRIQEAIEKEKGRHRDQNFTEVQPEDIKKKLKQVKSPHI